MDEVVAHSQASITAGSSSFSAASRLFGRKLREDVWLLYAWCRYCDDEIDGQSGGGASVPLTPAERAARLARLRSLTKRALDREPMGEPAFQAFARVAGKHQLAGPALGAAAFHLRDVAAAPARRRAVRRQAQGAQQ